MTDQNNPETQGSGEAPSTPSSLDKFRGEDGTLDAEKLAKSYVELEKMTTQNRQAPKEKDPLIPDPRSGGPLTFDAFDAEFKEFNENGELSEATWASLEQRTGVSRQVIQDYAESRGLAETYRVEKSFESFGGKDAVDEAIAWAAGALPPEEIAQINEDFAAGGRLGHRALEDLTAKYTAATGGAKEVTSLSGDRSPGGSNGFTSKAEHDAAYREAHKAKDFTDYDARLAATRDKASLL